MGIALKFKHIAATTEPSLEPTLFREALEIILSQFGAFSYKI